MPLCLRALIPKEMLSFLLMNTAWSERGGAGGLWFWQSIEAFLAAAAGVEEIGPSINRYVIDYPPDYDLVPLCDDFGHIGLASAAGDPVGVWGVGNRQCDANRDSIVAGLIFSTADKRAP